MPTAAALRDQHIGTPEQPRDEVGAALDRIGPQEPPRAPLEEAWAAMSDEERRRVVDSLPAGHTPEEIERLTDGDWHFDAKVDVLDTLRRYFSRTGRSIYLASERRVYYPGQRSFIPDLLAVVDVNPKKRSKWVVSQEGKGLDWVLEVLHHGDRKKDLEENIEFYALLGIPEYFIYDCGQQFLWGHRLPALAARTYEPIRSHGCRYPSAILGLDLAIVDVRVRRLWPAGRSLVLGDSGRPDPRRPNADENNNDQLRFYHGTAELAGSSGLINKLENLVEEVQARRMAAQSRAEAVAQELAQLGAELQQTQERLRDSDRQARAAQVQAILAVLEVRQLPVSDALRERLQVIEDPAVLERALRRAMTCTLADEILEEG